jgi:DNA repair protein RadC
MDDIRLVDCFERLHQYLLRHEPNLQKLAESVSPYAYRSGNLSYFLTHLVALLTDLDEHSAEGKRRIRRLILELDEAAQPAEYVREHLMVREKGGVLQRPLGPTQKRKLGESIRNLKQLAEEHRAPGAPDNTAASLGIAFDIQMDRLEHLPARIRWVCEKLPCLSHLNAFRFLSRIGYPTLVPDSAVQTFFFRLGLLEKTGSALDVHLDACRAGAVVAQAIKRPINEVNIWVRAFTGALPGTQPPTSLCRRKPLCGRCPIQQYCQHFRYNQAQGEGGPAPLTVKQWRATDRPRERLMEHGAHALEDTELLAIILRTGSAKCSVMDLSRKLLERFGTLQGIEEASLEELQAIHGIGRMKAVELKAVFELGRRQAFCVLQPGDTIESSDDVFHCYRGRYSHAKQEEFILLMLDNKNQVIREEMISRGGLDASIVHPREVFKAAIRASAATVLFIHNHPSGDPTPSHDDHVITQRLEEAASFLQMHVLDHIIIGADSYYSFKEGEIVTPQS